MTPDVARVVDGLSDRAIAALRNEAARPLVEALELHKAGILSDAALTAVSTAVLASNAQLPFHGDDRLAQAIRDFDTRISQAVVR